MSLFREQRFSLRNSKNKIQFWCNTLPSSAAVLENSEIPLQQAELEDYLQVHDPHGLADSFLVAF